MKQFKRAKVVMLTANQKENSLKGYLDKSLLFNYQKEYKTIEAEKNHTGYFHLYITSDDEIKDGNWYIYNNELLRKFNEKTNPSAKLIKRNKKIIATTDSSLKITKSATGYTETRSRTFYSEESLPQPSQSFIEKYIEEYNKGNIITDVLVEYEEVFEHYKSTTEWELPKVNPKDNTIIIKKVKDSWSKDEVVELLNKYSEMIDSKIDYEAHMSACCIVPIPEWDHEKWIKENL